MRRVNAGSIWPGGTTRTKGQVRNWLAGHSTGGGGPDEPEEEFVAANEAGCRPGGNGGTYGARGTSRGPGSLPEWL